MSGNSNLYSQGFASTSLGSAGVVPIIEQRAPTSNDVTGPFGPLKIGQQWINQTSGSIYELVNLTTQGGFLTASWSSIGSSMGALNELTADTGVAMPVAGNINIVGGSGLTTTASGNTLTVSSAGGPVLSVTGTADQVLASPTTGAVVVSLIGPYTPSTYTADGVLYGNGTSSIQATGAVANGVLITSNTMVPELLPNGTTGQVLTATTGAPPSWESPVEGVETVDGNTGTAAPVSGVLNIVGSGTLSTAASGNTVTISSSATSLIGVTDTATPFLTALGSGAAVSMTGLNNTAVGYDAMNGITTGNDNTALGYAVLFHGTSASGNTAVGYSALLNNMTGEGNTAVGTNALQTVSNNWNVAVGFGSLDDVATGTWNVAVGTASGGNYTSGESSNVLIANAGTVTESNTIRIGTQGTGLGQQNLCYVAGITGATPVSGNTPQVVLCDNAGNLAPISSSTAGFVLTSNGTATPSFQAASGSSSYPITPYVVGPIGLAPYQTIQSAITAAAGSSSGMGNVYIMPGNYAETITLAPYVNLIGANLDALDQEFFGGPGTAQITGSLSFSGQGAVVLFGLSVTSTTSTPMLNVAPSGSSQSIVSLDNCSLTSFTAGTVGITSFGGFGQAIVFLNNCVIDVDQHALSSTGLTEIQATSCEIDSQSSDAIFLNGGNVSLNLYQCDVNGNASALNISNVDAAATSYGSLFISEGTSPAVNFTGAGTFNSLNDQFSSTNSTTYFIAGTGNFTYNNASPSSSATNIDPAITQVTYPTYLGSSTIDGNATVNGNLSLSTPGNKINVASGSNASIGTATLASGTVTVSTTAVDSSSLVFVSYNNPIGPTGNLSVNSASIVTGTSFVINSTSPTDASTVNWWIIN